MSIPYLRAENSPLRHAKEKSSKISELSNKSIKNNQSNFSKCFVIGAISPKKLRYGQRITKSPQEKSPFHCVDAYNREKRFSDLKTTLSYLHNFKSLKPRILNFMKPISFYYGSSRKNSKVSPLSPIENYEKLKQSRNYDKNKARSAISKTPELERKGSSGSSRESDRILSVFDKIVD